MKEFKKCCCFAVVLAICCVSCKKDGVQIFEEDAMVYVANTVDSTEYTFSTRPSSTTMDSVIVNFRIIGASSTSDRTIKLEPNAVTTAKAGYHYKVGKAVIKANQFSADVPIYVYRRTGLRDSTLVVSLNVVANADFKPGYVSKLRYKFTLNDVISKPSNWETRWAVYFGTYSDVKFKFILEVTGKTDWVSSPSIPEIRYQAQLVRNALLAYNQANGALIDEFGQSVFFP